MTLSDGHTTTLRVGDVVNLKDDHQYRVLKIFAPFRPIVFKRTDGSTHRSFCALLTTLSSALIRWSIGLLKLTPQVPPLMILSLTLFYNNVAPLLSPLINKAFPIVWAMLIGSRSPKSSTVVSSSLWDTNYKEEGIMTMPNTKECRIIKQR